MAKNSAKALSKGKPLCERYRVTDGKGFRLKQWRTDETNGLEAEESSQAKSILADLVERMSDLQEKLYAQNRWSLLVIFQAMDAAGKDSTIKQVMTGLNPQGCQVFSFKAPSEEELDHDFLWRAARCLPERGRIGIFNRSYYEETLVVRVHPEFLERQRLPPQLLGKRLWEERFKSIVAFERHLANNGTVVLKFFLNVSKAEQKKRFLERLDNPAKNWKFSEQDVIERGHWKDYMAAYQEAIRYCAAPHAPWFVVPADNKWYTRLVVASAIVEALERLDLHFPRLDAAALKALDVSRRALLAER